MKKFLIIFSIIFSAFFSQNISAQSKDKETVTFHVTMHCHTCEQKIKDNIRFEKGVTAIKTDLKAQTVEITYKSDKTDKETLSAALTKIGYKPE
ncbi:MAG: heavy-metal-associated domain-containing protein [Candidatus Azobacteroides sp.]|nr:heavy-metal-associated domain-containing protein [Candidatus Azobacteroides sp.]